MSLARARTQTTQSGHERTNHEGTTSSGWGEKAFVPSSHIFSTKRLRCLASFLRTFGAFCSRICEIDACYIRWSTRINWEKWNWGQGCVTRRFSVLLRVFETKTWLLQSIEMSANVNISALVPEQRRKVTRKWPKFSTTTPYQAGKVCIHTQLNLYMHMWHRMSQFILKHIQWYNACFENKHKPKNIYKIIKWLILRVWRGQ